MKPVYLHSVAIAAPGLGDWVEAAPVLRGEMDYHAGEFKLTPPELLPATERRRSSDSVRLALRVAQEALSLEGTQAIQPAAIFSSAYGDPVITHKLCDMLSHTPPMASPTLFHNSVHNAPAGYWSIATTNPVTTTSIAAGDESFATGLLYAAAQVHADQRPVLLMSYDLPYPFPLSEKCPVTTPFASAMLLSHIKGEEAIAQLSITIDSGSQSNLEDGGLESLRNDNPAARALPLLAVIAHGDGKCTLPYQGEQLLHINVGAC